MYRKSYFVYKKEILFFGIVILFFPIFSTLFLFYLFFVLDADRGYKNFFIFFLISLFILLNTTRSEDGDLENYLAIYRFMNTSTLSGFFDDSNQFLVSFRLSEAVWYALTWIISNLTGANEFSYISILTLIIYGTYYYGLKALTISIGSSSTDLILVIFFGMLVCLNFSETSHLIRQYICGSVFFLQFVFIFKKKYLQVLFLLFAAIFIHNSLVIPFLVLILSYILSRQKVISNGILKIFIIPLIIGLIAGNLLHGIISLYNYEVSEGENTVFLSMVLDVSLYFVTLFFYFYSKNRTQFKVLAEGYLIFCMIFLGCLFFLKDNMTLYLRFYLYLEWFRIFGFIALLFLVPSFKRSVPFLIGCIMFCFVFFGLRVIRAPWVYGIDIYKILGKSFMQLLIDYF